MTFFDKELYGFIISLRREDGQMPPEVYYQKFRNIHKKAHVLNEDSFK